MEPRRFQSSTTRCSRRRARRRSSWPLTLRRFCDAALLRSRYVGSAHRRRFASLVLLAFLRQLPLLSLSLAADDGKPAVAPRLLVEGGGWVLLLAPWAPDRSLGRNLGGWRPHAPLGLSRLVKQVTLHSPDPTDGCSVSTGSHRQRRASTPEAVEALRAVRISCSRWCSRSLRTRSRTPPGASWCRRSCRAGSRRRCR